MHINFINSCHSNIVAVAYDSVFKMSNHLLIPSLSRFIGVRPGTEICRYVSCDVAYLYNMLSNKYSKKTF